MSLEDRIIEAEDSERHSSETATNPVIENGAKVTDLLGQHLLDGQDTALQAARKRDSDYYEHEFGAGMGPVHFAKPEDRAITTAWADKARAAITSTRQPS